jgi:hypothetical protein
MTESLGGRYRAAARAYFVYGAVYFVGGAYLLFHGIGVRGSRTGAAVEWLAIGLVIWIGIPFLLRRPRPVFERWVLSRRDFARIVAVLMAFRAWKVFRVALEPDVASVPAPWGGSISFRPGAAVFFVVTVVALAFVARAAWAGERRRP